jgi:hypothetical protein
LGAAEKEECPDEQQATNTQQAAAAAGPATPATAARPKPKPQIKMPAKGANRFRLT